MLYYAVRICTACMSPSRARALPCRTVARSSVSFARLCPCLSPLLCLHCDSRPRSSSGSLVMPALRTATATVVHPLSRAYSRRCPRSSTCASPSLSLAPEPEPPRPNGPPLPSRLVINTAASLHSNHGRLSLFPSLSVVHVFGSPALMRGRVRGARAFFHLSRIRFLRSLSDWRLAHSHSHRFVEYAWFQAVQCIVDPRTILVCEYSCE